ncbi:unnamed protein product [Urochloa humidicola]
MPLLSAPLPGAPHERSVPTLSPCLSLPLRPRFLSLHAAARAGPGRRAAKRPAEKRAFVPTPACEEGLAMAASTELEGGVAGRFATSLLRLGRGRAGGWPSGWWRGLQAGGGNRERRWRSSPARGSGGQVGAGATDRGRRRSARRSSAGPLRRAARAPPPGPPPREAAPAMRSSPPRWRWRCCRRRCSRLRLDLAGPLVELPALLLAQVSSGGAVLLDGDEEEPPGEAALRGARDPGRSSLSWKRGSSGRSSLMLMKRSRRVELLWAAAWDPGQSSLSWKRGSSGRSSLMPMKRSRRVLLLPRPPPHAAR